MSLLDKATIITTPTAHSNGKLHSIKGGAVADFDVVRGSAATRVNAEGLIEDISVLSGELVTNGGFDTDSNWSKIGNTTISGGKLNIINSNSVVATQGNVWEVGKTYKVIVQCTFVSGSRIILPYDGSNPIKTINTPSTDTYTYYCSPTSTTLFIYSDGNGNGSIDNISVKEVIDATNIPRIDYTTGEGVILTEPQSTNLVTYSEDFSDVSWTKNNTTITSGFVSPEGANNALKMVESNLLERHFMFRTTTGFTPSVKYTHSWYVKAGERYNVRIADAADGSYFGSYNLSTGALIDEGTSSVGGTTITELSNGWYRLTLVSDQATGARYPFIGILPNDYIAGDGLYYQGDGTSGVYIWGAQLEALSYSTSYIPTSGAIATRLADIVTGAGDATTINSTEGVLYFEGGALVGGGINRIISLSDGTSDNLVQFRLDTSPISLTSFLRGNGGSFAIKSITGITQTDINKIALVWNATNLIVWLNGVEAGTIATNDLPVGLNTLNFSNFAGGSNFYGKTKTIAVFSEALTDEELTCLTTI